MLDSDLDLDSGRETKLEKTRIRAWILHVRHAHAYTQERLAVVPEYGQFQREFRGKPVPIEYADYSVASDRAAAAGAPP